MMQAILLGCVTRIFSFLDLLLFWMSCSYVLPDAVAVAIFSFSSFGVVGLAWTFYKCDSGSRSTPF